MREVWEAARQQSPDGKPTAADIRRVGVEMGYAKPTKTTRKIQPEFESLAAANTWVMQVLRPMESVVRWSPTKYVRHLDHRTRNRTREASAELREFLDLVDMELAKTEF